MMPESNFFCKIFLKLVFKTRLPNMHPHTKFEITTFKNTREMHLTICKLSYYKINLVKVYSYLKNVQYVFIP